ncbi:hypothetical protein BN1263300003 [Stenotrophomonas indicatrix]|nr:hypothetical protein BN1263300003 [Stenotrophomonas indicatrix]
MQPRKAPPPHFTEPISHFGTALALAPADTPIPVSGTVADVPLRHFDPFPDPLLPDPGGTARAQPAGRSAA